MDLEIGNTVVWSVGEMRCKGLVLDEPSNGVVEVLVLEMNGKRARTAVFPSINILNKI